MVICIISGFCLSADLIIPSSIQADIIYKEQQQNKNVLVGKIYSVWSFIQKLSLALSAGVCLPLLGYFGFNPSELNTQLLPLSFAYGIIPIILRIPAIIFAENITLKEEHDEALKAIFNAREAISSLNRKILEKRESYVDKLKEIL